MDRKLSQGLGLRRPSVSGALYYDDAQGTGDTGAGATTQWRGHTRKQGTTAMNWSTEWKGLMTQTEKRKVNSGTAGRFNRKVPSENVFRIHQSDITGEAKSMHPKTQRLAQQRQKSTWWEANPGQYGHNPSPSADGQRKDTGRGRASNRLSLSHKSAVVDKPENTALSETGHTQQLLPWNTWNSRNHGHRKWTWGGRALGWGGGN